MGLLQLTVDEENVGEVNLFACATGCGDLQVTRAKAKQPVLEEVVALLVQHETHGVKVLLTFTNFFNDGELRGAKNDVVSSVIDKDNQGPDDQEDHARPEVELHVEEEVHLDDGAKNGSPPTHQTEHQADDHEGRSNKSGPDATDVYGGKENHYHQDNDESQSQAGGGGHLNLDDFAFVGQLSCSGRTLLEVVHRDFFTSRCGNSCKYKANQPEWPVVEDLAVADQLKFEVVFARRLALAGGHQVAGSLWSGRQQGVEILVAHCDSLLEHCVFVVGKRGVEGVPKRSTPKGSRNIVPNNLGGELKRRPLVLLLKNQDNLFYLAKGLARKHAVGSNQRAYIGERGFSNLLLTFAKQADVLVKHLE